MVGDRIKEIIQTLPPGVKLCAVSKYHPSSLIQEAYDAGQRIFGESHVQELQQKQEIITLLMLVPEMQKLIRP